MRRAAAALGRGLFEIQIIRPARYLVLGLLAVSMACMVLIALEHGVARHRPRVLDYGTQRYQRGGPGYDEALGKFRQNARLSKNVCWAVLAAGAAASLVLCGVGIRRGAALRQLPASCMVGSRGKRFEWTTEQWSELGKTLASAGLLPETDSRGNSYRLSQCYVIPSSLRQRIHSSLRTEGVRSPSSIPAERIASFVEFLGAQEGNVTVL